MSQPRIIATATERADESQRELLLQLSEVYHDGALPSDLLRAKCCGKCAFRAGSPERSDPYGWMRMVDQWSETGGPLFFCHEGVDGHDQQEQGQPLQVCAGFHAMKQGMALGVDASAWYDLAHVKERPTTRHKVEFFDFEQKVHCEDCKHCDMSGLTDENSETFNPCQIGRETMFVMPESPQDNDFGFFPDGWVCALKVEAVKHDRVL